MTVRPRLPIVEPDPVTQQQLREPVPGAHQLDADCFAGADQVAQRFLLVARDSDRVKSARQQQPHEVLGVTTIGLYAIRPNRLEIKAIRPPEAAQ